MEIDKVERTLGIILALVCVALFVSIVAALIALP
jgi:hypothetical protein